MMKVKNIFLVGLLVTFTLMSCDKNNSEEPKPEPPKPEVTINSISRFTYDGLSLYYKWADNMKSNKPTASDTDPKKYFKKLLYKSDTNHGWSWITDDAESLFKSHSGESLSFGYELGFTDIDGKIYAIIKYVFPNTPAAEKGLKRLDMIGEIDGQPIITVVVDGKRYISKKSWNLLYGNNSVSFSIYKHKDKAIVKKEEVEVTPRVIHTNPVLFDKVYTIGGKKIGYLFYTGFIGNYNNELYKVFSNFKNENVTDLVLDLRYNRGGVISSASYLASLIAPRSVVESKSTFVKLDYNKDINNLFDSKGWSRNVKLGEYKSAKEQNPLGANLNLNKIYVINTHGSYSAAELTPFCLKPFMEVVHIGTKTGGKYTASWTITPYDTRGVNVYDEKKLSSNHKRALNNWAMQPIVAIYGDKNGNNFLANDGLLPDYKLKEGFGAVSYWAPIGDTKDVLLGQALYLITGDETYKPKKESVVARGYGNQSTMYSTEFEMQDQQGYSESVIIDNVDFNQEELLKILK